MKASPVVGGGYELPQEMSEGLSAIRSTIESLNIPPATYGGIVLGKDGLYIAEIGGEKTLSHKRITTRDHAETEVSNWLKERAHEHALKFIALGIEDGKKFPLSISKLWLNQDIVLYPYGKRHGLKKNVATDIAQQVAAHFDRNNIVLTEFGSRNEVKIGTLVNLEDYQTTTDPSDFNLLAQLVHQLRGKRISFFNATAQGGGVALMRHALMRLFRILNVDAHWYVLEPRKEVFEVTKTKFHNIFQNVASPNTRLTAKDKDLYNAWMKENAELFTPVFKDSDVIVIDDPQPSGLIPYIRKINPAAKVIYRSHIQIVAHLADKPGTPQHEVWNFIWNNIKSSDYFISHPVRDFIPKDVPAKKTLMMPAVTDPLDGLNKPLSQTQLNYYMKLFNKFLLENKQTPLDPDRPYIIQIARFDPSKGIPDVIESYRILREMMKEHKKILPQLVITGNGSVDDPDGVPILNLVTEMLNSDKYKDIANDVKVARLPHIDQLLNTLLRKSAVCLQLSHKEGFEIKVTEALMKGIPIIAYRAGGIPLQIEDHITGFLVEVGNTRGVAKHLYDLLTDKTLYREMSENAAKRYRHDLLTIPNAICWLFLASSLLEKKPPMDGFGQSVYDLPTKHNLR